MAQCPSRAFSWSHSNLVGGTGCSSGTVPATNVGTSVTVSHSGSDRNGSATFTCNNGGSWSGASKATCSKNCSGTISWGSSGSDYGPCNATYSGVLLHGASTTVTSSSLYTGSATVLCHNTQWQISNPVCTSATNPCSAGTKTWTGSGGYPSCTASIGTGSAGDTQNLTDSIGTDQGSAKYTCTNGQWVESVSSCAAVGECPGGYSKCKAQTVYWDNSNCSSSIGDNCPSSGNPVWHSITDSSGDYRGSVSAVCYGGSGGNPGTYVLQNVTSSSCVKYCLATSVSWTVGAVIHVMEVYLIHPHGLKDIQRQLIVMQMTVPRGQQLSLAISKVGVLRTTVVLHAMPLVPLIPLTPLGPSTEKPAMAVNDRLQGIM